MATPFVDRLRQHFAPQSPVVRVCLLLICLLASQRTATAIAPTNGKGPIPPRAPFTEGKILKIHLEIPPAEYDAIQPKSAAPAFPGFPFFGPKTKDQPGQPAREVHKNTFGMNLPWGKGSITIDGETFSQVGIRYKGNGTILDAGESIKKSFKVDLDKFGQTKKYKTLKSLNLHCQVADPSKCREVFGYGIYSSVGVPAPRVLFVEVSLSVGDRIKNQWLGLYTLVEPIDKTFLAAHFNDAEGLLMKPEGMRDFPFRGEFKDYEQRLEPKRTAKLDEKARLFQVGKLVALGSDQDFISRIDSLVDIDSYLKFLAATAFISNPDSFFSLSHNYYLYLDAKTSKFFFFPWDLDRAFSNLFLSGTNNQQMDQSFLRPYGTEHKLTERILAMPGMRDRYLKLLGDYSQSTFALARLKTDLKNINQPIQGLIERDKTVTKARGEKKAAGPGFMLPPPGLELFLDRRTTSLANQLSGRSEGYIQPSNFQIGAILVGSVVAAFDTDKDERLSRIEWVNAIQKTWNNTPNKDDGPVGLKELTKGFEKLFANPAGPAVFNPFAPHQHFAEASIRRFDKNSDGKLTQEELSKGMDSLFDSIKTVDPNLLNESELCKMLVPFFKKKP